MPDRVPNEGTRFARLILIGEAPGRWEHVYGRPFVGDSFTSKLLPWWNDCTPKLERGMFLITNVLDYQPAWIDGVPELEMRQAFERLHALIAAHEGPDGGGPFVIVPTGNYALYALTGQGRVSFHRRDGKWERPGITDWRGSILEYQDTRGRRFKVIPTVHPADSMPFRTPQYEKPCRADWQRIAEDQQFRELRLPDRTRMITPSRAEAIEWIKWQRGMAAAQKDGEPCFERMAMSLDVETPKHVEYEHRQKESTAVGAKCATCGHTKRWHCGTDIAPTDTAAVACTKKATKKEGGRVCTCASFLAPMGKPRKVKISEEPYLDCIGYSSNPSMAMCIPTTLKYWQDPAEWALVKAAMAALHADPNIDFCGQNFPFDTWWAAEEGMPILNPKWDLLKMHRTRCPGDAWHDLAYQASLYTREPFWKHEAKDPDSIQRYQHGTALWSYNCTDNGVQIELLPLHILALIALGRYEYFQLIEAPMDPALGELSRHGFRADLAGRARHFDMVTAEQRQLSAELNAAAGMPIVAVHKKSGAIIGKVPSPAKLKHFLYEHLRLPVQYTTAVDNSEGGKKKKKVVSTNVVTIKRLMERFPVIEQLQVVGAKTLRMRRMSTEANFVKEAAVSGDGRVYAQFVQETALGRLKSRKLPNGKGRNLQNIDRKLRRFFLPDTGEEKA